MKIFFLENSPIKFNGEYIDSNDIRGTEKTLINITAELAKLKFDVYVFNNTPVEKKINNVNWLFFDNNYKYEKTDIAVAWSDVRFLNSIKCKNKYLWSHSVQTIEKFIRKRQFISFLINKPKVILESNYHFENRNFITSPYGKFIVKLAPDDAFLNTSVDKDFIPDKNAIFITRPDRNIRFLLDCWNEIIKKSYDSKLYINPPFKLTDKDKSNNVYLRNPSNRKKLIQELLNSRVMLIPGHKGEVFCYAAEEAREMCVPIVTMGYGCLAERVIHEKTGFIAKTRSDFINYSNIILNDDKAYINLKRNLLSLKKNRTFIDVSKDFINILLKNYKK